MVGTGSSRGGVWFAPSLAEILPRARPAARLRAALVWVGVVGVSAGPLESTAIAAPNSVRLVYEGAPAACPSSADLQDRVAAKLGYVPWASTAVRVIRLRIHDAADGVWAELRIEEPAGQVLGTRKIDKAPDCPALREPIVLAMTIAIDPLSLGAERAAPPPDPEPTSTSTSAKRTAEATPPVDSVDPAGRDLRVRAGLGAVVSAGAAPSVAFGGRIHVGLRWPAWSLGLEGRIDAPSSEAVGSSGSVESSLVLASFVPCGHLGGLFGCVLLHAGALRGASEGLEDARGVTEAYAAVGARVGYELQLNDRVGLLFGLDVNAVLNRIALVDTTTGQEFWRTPVINGTLGISGNFEFD